MDGDGFRNNINDIGVNLVTVYRSKKKKKPAGGMGRTGSVWRERPGYQKPVPYSTPITASSTVGTFPASIGSLDRGARLRLMLAFAKDITEGGAKRH